VLAFVSPHQPVIWTAGDPCFNRNHGEVLMPALFSDARNTVRSGKRARLSADPRRARTWRRSGRCWPASSGPPGGLEAGRFSRMPY